MYSCNGGLALQNFVLLIFILVMHLQISNSQAMGVLPHDTAVNRYSNVGPMEPKKYLAKKNSYFSAMLARRSLIHTGLDTYIYFIF